MTNKTLKEKFNEIAENYDHQRESLIPCFHDIYNITVDLAYSNSSKPKILDIGAGTGLLTKYLFEKYPKARFTLIDMSEEMLKIAKNRFKACESSIHGIQNLRFQCPENFVFEDRKNFKFLHDSENFKYIVADYTTHDFKDSFDIIVSSLSIHHLEDKDKEKLYKKIYNALNPEGIFLNADQILGPTPTIENNYQKNWIGKINKNDLSESEKNSAIERMSFDKPATLEDNLKWLKNSGFNDVDIYYKYYNFTINIIILEYFMVKKINYKN